MTNAIAPITDSTWAIITYEEAWNSFINSYVIQKGDAFVVIDSHLRKQRAYFQQALEEIGVKAEQIEYVYFTHRHADHIGNADLFPSRNNWIHLEDYYELDDFSQTLFGHTFTGTGGDLPVLRFRQLPFHTEGSVAFFDPQSKVCFVGDHLIFGESKAELGQIVGTEDECRTAYKEYVKAFAQKEPERALTYVAGLEILLDWPIECLATGHGLIFQGEIVPFIQELISLVKP
ncbi:MBL fold metallo-hydrolase [Brevibacillus reuszeri]|uniref:MBL fold metallo-hydrolase n=1 Tax=Brevibacillus reuszeri TaxID=54915 RepID=UPI000CCC7F53|nr:MBL fold metallo-hydrolase [Brevibacillus reuszeri]